MRATEFLQEDMAASYDITIKHPSDRELEAVAIDPWGNIAGSVLFNIGDNKELDPQDLRVSKEHRGRGLAKKMYDTVKQKGYTINKSRDLSTDGEHFWKKNRDNERVWEAKYDFPLQDFMDTPYDSGQEYQQPEHDIMRGKNPDNNHRGPQEGKYLNLMLKGIKPISVVPKDIPGWAEIFMPYVKSGKIILAHEDEEAHYFTLPGEEWRAKKVKSLFDKLRDMWDNDQFDRKTENILDAKIGRLLGIPKVSVRYFINN